MENKYYPEDYKKENSYPVLICIRDEEDKDDVMAAICEDFANQGYIAYLFMIKSGSDADSQTENLLADIEHIINDADLDLDRERIYLIGRSYAGLAAGKTAAKFNDKIAGLIMISPTECMTYQECQKISGYKGRVLLIHGMNDEVIHYSHSLRLKDMFWEDNCQLQLMRGVRHNLDGQRECITASIRQFLNGKKEIFAITIIITDIEEKIIGDTKKTDIYFTGYTKSSCFTGTILPGGCDAREAVGGVETKVRAEYTLDGVDMAGKHCKVHIVNQWGETDWKPVIDTDSEKLAWLNDAKCSAVLEAGEGLVIRVYTDIKK